LRLDLDKEGFIISQHKSDVLSSVKELHQVDTNMVAYYAEHENFLRGLLQVNHALAFNHVVRDNHKSGTSGAIHRVHVDWSETSGPMVVRNRYPNAEELLKERVRIFTLWRPMNGPTYDDPLAVCDARTVKSEDLVPTDLVFDTHIGENYSVRYSPEHRWYYAKGMVPEEVLVFKNYDSQKDVARFVPHTAFSLQSPAPIKRKSIEVRVLVLG